MPLTENFDILPTNVEYPFLNVYKTPAYEAVYIHHVSTVQRMLFVNNLICILIIAAEIY